MSMDDGARESDHGARPLQGAMLEHAGLAIERMPGLSFALNRFIAEAPARLAALIARPSGAAIEEIRATTLFEAIEECSGLTAAIYASAEPEARFMIALDERIDELIVSSIFGEAVGADRSDIPGSHEQRPRTAIEVSLIEAFARALGEALQAAFAPVARIAFSFERLTAIKDLYALGRRDGEAAAARFTLRMMSGVCQGLLLLPQAFLLPFRAELANNPEADAPAADRRWSRLMEAGVQQTRLPVTAVLEEVPMSLGDVADFRVGGLLPLQCNDFNAIRLECSGRGMFTCKLGQAEGRYRLEVEGPIAQGHEAAKS
ncbi:MAG: FliM/FliN family flagellar motor switch protein [Hyphomicrobiales bacterium]|nr:FliM/FliN family flagellar motor switch protein [Hyphomicrobiales bacterium]